MKKLLLLFLLIPTLLYAAPPSRVYTYTTGSVISASENTQNEDAIFNYLTRGVDTLADNAVTTDKILDGTITNSKLAGGITNSKLAGGITNSKLADGVTLPTGAVFFMITGSCPTGTTDVTATYSNKFLRVNATQGSTGGSDTVTIAEANLPSHTHTGPSHTHTGPSHTHAAGSLTGGAHTHPEQYDNNPLYYLSGGATIHQTMQTSNNAEFTTIENTGSGGAVAVTGSTAAGGTGATGASGTGATGAIGSGTATTITNPYVTCKMCQVN